MSDTYSISVELHDINLNLAKLNDTIQFTALTIYRGLISAAKIQSAQNAFERNTAMKEADDFLNQIEQKETNFNGGKND